MHLRDEGDNHPTRSDCPEKRARQQFPTMLGAKENAAPQSEQLPGTRVRARSSVPRARRCARSSSAEEGQKEAEQQAQQNAQAQQQQTLDTFKAAFSACMDARQYSVKREYGDGAAILKEDRLDSELREERDG